MGLLDKIKEEAKKSGSNKGKFIYFREGEKHRIRFLNDMDDGLEIKFHDSYAEGINVPCQEIFGRTCNYCDREDLRTRSQYIWSVWDYDAKEVKLFMFPVNNCSPIPALMALYENYGTLTDRDYIVSVTGKQQTKTYSVIPMDKVKFRNEKAKPIAEKAVLKYIDKAWPCDDSDSDDEVDEDEDEEENTKTSTSNNSKSKTKSKPKQEDEDESEDEDVEVDYSEMTPIQLFKLCKERDIKVPPKKPAKFYINQLKEYDKAQDDWSDEDSGSEDEWEDED
jgi:hypothetical protein